MPERVRVEKRSQGKNPKPRPETLRKRQEILAAASRVFGSKGYVNGTLADVAGEVGITHAGVLHHFGSKEQLLIETLRFRDSQDLVPIQRQTIPEGEELFEHLIRTAELNEKRSGIVQTYTVLLAEAMTDNSPGRQYFTRRFQVLRSEVAEALARMCEDLGVVPDPARLDSAAAAILGAMDGIQSQWLLEPSAVDLPRATELAIRAIVDSIIRE